MDYATIKIEIKKLLSTSHPPAEDWANIMAYLQELKPRATQEARAREVIARKKFRELRPTFKTRVDTEDEWTGTQEWLDWKEAEDRLEEIEDWKTVASRQTSARYKNY